MPAAQGVLKWPTGRPALATLIDESRCRCRTPPVDRVLLVHALEMSDDPERCCGRCGGCWRPRDA